MFYFEFINKILDLQMQQGQELFQQITELTETNRELESIIENSYDGISIVNPKGITIRVNPAMERLTGLKAQEVVGKDMRQLVQEGVFADSVSLRVLKEKRPITIMQKSRTGKQTIMTGTPIYDENGNINIIVINIRDISELHRLKEQLEKTQELTNRYHWEINELRRQVIEQNDIIAESKAMQEILDLALRVAKVDSNVLLLGESGVGKEVLSKIIHKSSNRYKSGSFIKINSGAIPLNLLESELFGYEAGAFTGARKNGKPGMFQLASGGTLFLDEIAELPLELQVKLLRVIQEQEVVPLGGVKPVKVDVRIIAATNKNLKEMVEKGTFRQDLFYRLNVISIKIPPLRERREDIPALAAHFITLLNEKYQLNKQFTPEALKLLISFSWPGNVRQLSNIVERCLVTSKNEKISKSELAAEFEEANAVHFHISDQVPLKKAVELFEQSLINRALNTYGTTYKAAEALQVSQASIARKAKKYRDFQQGLSR